jgi:lysyl-tRNA synthetase class 2
VWREGSLNFAVFRSALERRERIGDGPVAKTWFRTLIFACRWFQIESLYRFNGKFSPVWEPRYAVFPGTTALPGVVGAYMEAEAFVIRPKLLRR